MHVCNSMMYQGHYTLETDNSGIVLRAGLLQVKDGMNCGQDEVLDNRGLYPIAFASKSLSSTEQ